MFLQIQIHLNFKNLANTNTISQLKKPCKTVILAGESRSSICVDVDAKPRSGCSSGNIIIKMMVMIVVMTMINDHDYVQEDDHNKDSDNDHGPNCYYDGKKSSARCFSMVLMKKMMLTLELGWSSIWVAVEQRVWTDTKSRLKVGATFLPSYQFTLPLAHPSFF